MDVHQFKNITDQFAATAKMPVLFIGHGSPMNGIVENEFSKAWIAQGEKIPKPKAILCISAHWFTKGTYVHGAGNPKTIHDFWGFPKELYEMRYNCPGSPILAKDLQDTIKATNVGWDLDWGLDHGAWIVLSRLFPKADIPVFQMSIDLTKPSQFHYELAKELTYLRHKGVLIVGSGNVVHNLGMVSFETNAKPFDWAEGFNEKIKSLILEGDHQALIRYEQLGHEALLSIPTPDHYWPLLYTLAAKEKHDQIEIFTDGIAHGSVSMMSFVLS
jgi:4,5-DOPA dioxygenase extradiol